MKTLIVSVPAQEVRLYDNGEPVNSWPASTSQFGLGTEEGSNKTPLGKFRICEKYGGRAREGTIFKGRKASGHWSSSDEVDSDLVLTRILRLEGISSEVTNTYLRYIYFHGTNQENLIGHPSSHGCIRLRNSDITTLYSLVSVGTLVEIRNTSFS